MGPIVRRAWTLTLTLIATVVIASCGGGPRSLSDLKSVPESGLHPPDARLVSHIEQEAGQTIDGPLEAMVGDIFATRDNPDGILAFYESELTRRGYVRDEHDLANIGTTVEETVRVWRHDDVVARVGIYRTGDVRLPPVPSDMADGAMFELVFMNAYPASPAQTG